MQLAGERDWLLTRIVEQPVLTLWVIRAGLATRGVMVRRPAPSPGRLQGEVLTEGMLVSTAGGVSIQTVEVRAPAPWGEDPLMPHRADDCGWPSPRPPPGPWPR